MLLIEYCTSPWHYSCIHLRHLASDRECTISMDQSDRGTNRINIRVSLKPTYTTLKPSTPLSTFLDKQDLAASYHKPLFLIPTSLTRIAFCALFQCRQGQLPSVQTGIYQSTFQTSHNPQDKSRMSMRPDINIACSA